MKIFAVCAFVLLQSAQGQNYCAGGPTRAEDANLGAVTLVGAASIQDTENSCPGTLGIGDKTGLKADLQTGGTYDLKATVTTCGLVLPRAISAWIDYNGNGVFEANEEVGSGQATAQQPTLENTWSFSPPCTATVGVTRMRVMVIESGMLPMNPCEAYSWGAAKDFTIEILSSPGALCGGSDLGPGGVGGMSGGTLFLILVFVGAILYIGGGCFYLRKYKGATGVTDSCLGYSQMMSFFGLVKDGCYFSKSKAKELMNKRGGGGGAGESFEKM